YGYGNASEQYVIRGFALYGEDIAIDGLYGITPRQLQSPELYDQIQVLNGASAFLFGAAPGGSALGGTVNLEPKRATMKPINRVTVNYISGSQVGGSFDFGRRFGSDGALGVRINGSGRWGDDAINDEYRASQVLGLGVDFKRGNLRLSLDLAYQREKVRHMRPMVQVYDVSLPLAPSDPAENYGQPWNYTTLRDIFGLFKAEYDITKDFTLYGQFGAKNSHEAGQYQSLYIYNSAAGTGVATGSFIPRKDDNMAEQVGIRARLVTGPISHKLSLGISAIQQSERTAFGFGNFGGTATSLYTPVAVPVPDFSYFPGGNISNPYPITRLQQFSMFVSDTMSVADGKLLVTVGARRQKIHQDNYGYYDSGALDSYYAASKTTPVIGVVVHPVKALSVYFNRIAGLSQGGTAPINSAYSNSGQSFAPYSTTQYEVGSKLEIGHYSASLAFYTVEKPNYASAVQGTQYLYVVDGVSRHRGIEFTFNAEPVKGLRLISGFSVVDAKLHGSSEDGKTELGVPKFTANANVEWDMPYIRGFTLTGRVIHTASQFYDEANTMAIPEWTRYDLGARYVFTAHDLPVTLRFNVDNVANKSYWASTYGTYGGQLVQGMPRTFKASATIDF
ncbi:MAG TPA: TonB-dependent receptor, partial [Novosphingobium sp.]|nr:TonB-dependent receptor [Novosphingobium sp.]